MKVRCKNFNAAEKEKNSAWITEGKEYYVLCVSYSSREKFFYRIIGDNSSTPALFESELFDIVSSKIPNNWVIDLKEGILELAPQSWLEDGFWEKYFDDEKEAIEIFDKEYQEILACDQYSEIKEAAQPLSDNWLMCPVCQESWEDTSTYSTLRCPKCSHKLLNPKFKPTWMS